VPWERGVSRRETPRSLSKLCCGTYRSQICPSHKQKNVSDSWNEPCDRRWDKRESVKWTESPVAGSVGARERRDASRLCPRHPATGNVGKPFRPVCMSRPQSAAHLNLAWRGHRLAPRGVRRSDQCDLCRSGIISSWGDN